MALPDEEGLSAKRRKTDHDVDGKPQYHLPFRPPRTSYSYDSYSIAWICALHMEMAAAQAMLDEIHPDLPRHGNDSNTYVLGRIREHNVVIACLPSNQYGTNNAANVLSELRSTFVSVRAGLMVGIGGGVPVMGEKDIHLGDVVVGLSVMQSDLGKMVDNAQIQRTAIPKHPSPELLKAVQALQAQHDLEPSQMASIFRAKMGQYPTYQRPTTPDRLFNASYNHTPSFSNCNSCDQNYLVQRATRASEDPSIHYGLIASGNQVVKSGLTRDDIARKHGVICFEMETAGLMNILPCLAVRGICDYADSHKNSDWQRYAAGMAAAYATELLSKLPASSHPGVQQVSALSGDIGIQRRARLREMLRFDQIYSRRTNIETALSKTCDWFLEHDAYKTWMNPGEWKKHRGFLWIKGKPGVGKSTIMKFIFRQHKDHFRNQTGAIVSFFFNARGEKLEKSLLGLYRSLLLQIIDAYPDVGTVLDDSEIDHENRKLFESLNVLVDLFHSAVSMLGRRPLTCFIDALDECDELRLLDMINDFEKLSKVCAGNGTHFKVCFSSRHYPCLLIRWGFQVVLENEPGHQSDMAQYIDQRLRITDTRIIEELRPRLLEKAAGVFMWIVLVVGILNNEESRGRLALRRRVNETPSDLSKLFKSILTRDEDDKEHLLLALRWILCAARPLHPREFYHAMWSGLSTKGLVDQDIPDASSKNSSEMVNRSIITQTKGLAEATRSEKPTVQFIHESVRDFLVRERGLQEIWPDMSHDWAGPSHEDLKQCCEVYLNQKSIQRHFRNSKITNPNDIKIDHPFLEYATQYVLHHGNLAAVVVPQGDFICSFSLSKWIELNNIYEWYKIRRYGRNAGFFYVLADRGHSRLIRTVVEKYGYEKFLEEPNNSRYKYSFFAALAHGNVDCIASLLGLESGQQESMDNFTSLKDHNDVQGKAYKGFTPFSWAAHNGLLDVARLLAPIYDDVSVHDGEGRTPLSRAVQTGEYEMAKYLIELGSDVNVKDKGVFTPRIAPLLMATGLKMVQLLVGNGADIETADPEGRTPLIKASLDGDKAVVAFLLEKGADTEAATKRGETALIVASGFGNNRLSYLSLNSRETSTACRLNGPQQDIVSLLLQHGAQVNAVGTSGNTALAEAFQFPWSPEIAHLLLEHGANVHVTSIFGYADTPLIIACSSGNQQGASWLLEKGADVDYQNVNGQTALMEASRTGMYDIVSQLLTQGADVDYQDIDGQTALMEASRTGMYDIVSQLLTQGANVNARDHSGITALGWAKDTQVRQLLTSHGARGPWTYDG